MDAGNLGSALLFGALPALALLAIVYGLDRYEKEPVRLLAIALGFGAVIAPALAVGVQSILDVPTSVTFQSTVPFARLNVTTPIVEEVVRGLAILAVFILVRREIDGALDGLVYGGAVGIGFGLAATFMAILTAPSLGFDTSASLFAATVAGVNHLFYAGLIGLALALARNASAGTMFGAWIAGVGLATGFHLLHDYLPHWGAASLDGTGGLPTWIAEAPNVLGLVALAVLFAWGAARESRVVAEELRDEVTSGAVTAEEYAVVTDPWKRFATLGRALFAETDWSLRRRLYATEVELAFRKRRGSLGAKGTADVDAIRRQIAETRRELVATEAGA